MLLQMNRNSAHRCLLGTLAAIVAATWLALAPATAVAAAPEGGAAAEATERSQLERWKGRFCTATRCAGTPASPWSAAAGFATAILATGWISRRQPARNDPQARSARSEAQPSEGGVPRLCRGSAKQD